VPGAATQPAAVKSSIPEHAIKAEAKETEDVDHELMRERLYKAASALSPQRSTG
jgi:hypothetical protein